MIARISEKNKESTKLDIVEGTFQMFKIITTGMMAPARLFIKYKEIVSANSSKKVGKRKELRDLRVYYSTTHPNPDEKNYEGTCENPTCINLESEERIFAKDFIYIKFETFAGCQAKMRLVFPK